jgi:alanyl-tRNA synthetase
VRQVAPLLKGGGGGRAEMAQAGGSDPSGLDQALAEAARIALDALQAIEAR